MSFESFVDAWQGIYTYMNVDNSGREEIGNSEYYGATGAILQILVFIH